MSEKGEVLLRGVGTLQYLCPPNASAQWQPDGLTIHAKEWFPGAGFLGAPSISLIASTRQASCAARSSRRCACAWGSLLLLSVLLSLSLSLLSLLICYHHYNYSHMYIIIIIILIIIMFYSGETHHM